MIVNRYVDYIWTDGFVEEVFHGKTAYGEAQFIRKLCNRGKIWRREFREGLLEGITDVTDVEGEPCE